MDQIRAATDKYHGAHEFSSFALGLPLIQLVEPETDASGKQEAMKELPMVGVLGRLKNVRQRSASGCSGRRQKRVLGPVIILFPVRGSSSTYTYCGHYPMFEPA